MVLEASEVTGLRVPAVWGGVPQKNKNFTGRESLLADLRRQLAAEGADVTAVLPQALKGLGGVGKTQLAVEYAYRFQSGYDLVWWVPSDQPALVRSTLAALAPQLGLSGNLRVEDAVSAVLDALRRGEPYRNWLLIFDNADQPESFRGLLPHGPGHVLVTSRNPRWESIVNTVEVDVFAREESLEFLQRRVPGIDATDAGRLAIELGHLPLALEQAGALQVETGMAVQEYLELLDDQANKLLAENVPSDYPKPVAAAWGLSMNRLKEHAPFALELLRRCAFFGPEPISLDLFYRGKDALGTSEFGRTLRDRLQVGRALRELGRYSLARIDNINKTIQVHRLIQRLIAGELSPEEQGNAREDVHKLLVAADPVEAWDASTWPQFAALLPHIGPSGIVQATDPAARRLVWHVVEYLNYIGDFTTAVAQADVALRQWVSDSGPADPDVLILNGTKADAVWGLGRYQEAFELRQPTLERIIEVLGRDHEETLKILNGHGADLRARGEFEAARQLDEDSLERHNRVYGDDNFRTHNAANNLAVDYVLTSSYSLALGLDQKTLVDRRNLHGPDAPHVVHQLSAVARDQRQAGQYLEARRTAEQAYLAFQDLVDRGKIFEDHPWVLLQAKDLSVARRKAGAFPEALNLAVDVYNRYRRSGQFESDHPDTLAAGINLGNAQRVAGDSAEATDRIDRTVRRYRDSLGPDHPYTHGSALNLALVHRQVGRLDEARALLEEALNGLENSLGHDHHYTLTCLVNLATTSALRGEAGEALKMGESALPRFRKILGMDHPHTLVCATNVALDLAAVGRTDESTELSDDTMVRYRRVLGVDHPDVIAGMRGERLDFDFEPPPL